MTKIKKPRNAGMMFLSSNDYYVYMVLGLYKNLLDTKTRYPIYCAVTEDVNEQTRQLLTTVGIKVLPLYTKGISKDRYAFKLSKLTGYANALAKISLLSSEVEKHFDKIIYLDSDMGILSNIDELFKKPHMTAVINHSPQEVSDTFYAGKSNFCSGLFVGDYKENPGLGHKLLTTLSKLPQSVEGHDQAILNYGYQDGNKHPELHLDYHYGLMNCNNPEDFKNLKVIHFVSRNRDDGPFDNITTVPKTYFYFKRGVSSINNSIKYFNTTYNLNITELKSENIRYKTTTADNNYLYF